MTLRKMVALHRIEWNPSSAMEATGKFDAEGNMIFRAATEVILPDALFTIDDGHPDFAMFLEAGAIGEADGLGLPEPAAPPTLAMPRGPSQKTHDPHGVTRRQREVESGRAITIADGQAFAQMLRSGILG